MKFIALMLVSVLTLSLSAQPQYQHTCVIRCKHALGNITFVKKLNEDLIVAVNEHGWAEILNYKEPNNTHRQYFILPKNLFYPLHKTILLSDNDNETYFLVIVMTHNTGQFKRYVVSEIKSSSDQDRRLTLDNLHATKYGTDQLQRELVHVQSNIQDGALSCVDKSSLIISFQKKMCTNNLIDPDSMQNFTPVISYHNQNDMLIFGHQTGIVSVWTKSVK